MRTITARCRGISLSAILNICSIAVLFLLISFSSVEAQSDGVWAWGASYFGELGSGTSIYNNVPVQSNISGVVAVAAGGSHTVAVKSDGTVWTWGSNVDGQLGNGTSIISSNVPVQANISGVVAVAAGGGHTVALTSLFHDVLPWFWAHDYIDAIYYAGITTGCTQEPLNYCPSTDVNRAQMAAFIIRAKFGESFTYDTTRHFTDVTDTHWAFKYIQKMFEEGISTGYGDGIYGPSLAVNRASMAAFLARVFLGMQ